MVQKIRMYCMCSHVHEAYTYVKRTHYDVMFSTIRGFHVYKTIWENPALGEEQQCKRAYFVTNYFEGAYFA